MKIAIDVSQIVYGTGVSNYTANLVRHLLKIDKKNQYILFGTSLRQRNKLFEFKKSLGIYENVTFKFRFLPPTLFELLANRLRILSVENLIGQEVDVFHSSDWTQPPTKAFKVTTIHDLFPIKFPKLTHPKIVSALLNRFKWVIREADMVIVPSRTTKEDLAEFGIGERVVVISEAPNPALRLPSKLEIERVKRKYQISGLYLLSIGVNPRKNTERIISAFEKVRPGLDLKLIIIGHPYMKIEPVRGVKILGHVPLSDLSGLYSGSEALVYPSLYEGFGLPILEAYKCETPVVTSNVGTMQELGQGAAILVDPTDVNSIAEGVKKAIKDRESLIKKGRERVEEFSWTKVAENTIKVYQKANQ